jgi:hypothetical protein
VRFALSQNDNPTPLWRMLDCAQRWAASMSWSGHDRVLELLEQTNALATPERARELDLHLLDPYPTEQPSGGAIN